MSGVRYLASFPLLLAQLRSPLFGPGRGNGLLDGGAPFYNVYTCADGRWMSVGCLEPQFFKAFLKSFLSALPPDFALEDGWRPSEADQHDTDSWPRMKTFMERGFALHPRDHWGKVFDGTIPRFFHASYVDGPKTRHSQRRMRGARLVRGRGGGAGSGLVVARRRCAEPAPEAGTHARGRAAACAGRRDNSAGGAHGGDPKGAWVGRRGKGRAGKSAHCSEIVTCFMRFLSRPAGDAEALDRVVGLPEPVDVYACIFAVSLCMRETNGKDDDVVKRSGEIVAEGRVDDSRGRARSPQPTGIHMAAAALARPRTRL